MEPECIDAPRSVCTLLNHDSPRLYRQCSCSDRKLLHPWSWPTGARTCAARAGHAHRHRHPLVDHLRPRWLDRSHHRLLRRCCLERSKSRLNAAANRTLHVPTTWPDARRHRRPCRHRHLKIGVRASSSVQCRPKRIPNQLAVIPITVWCRRYAAALRVRGGFFVTEPTHVAVGKH